MYWNGVQGTCIQAMLIILIQMHLPYLKCTNLKAYKIIVKLY